MFATMYKPISEFAPSWAGTKITDIFKIISYSYTKKFYEVGSFSMVIPANEPSAELLETNTFLSTNDGDYLFVTGIKETESRITLEGFDLKYLLAGRITLFPTEEQDVGTYGYYVTKGSTGECICDIVRHNIMDASDPNRRIYGFSVNNSAQGLAEDTYMTRLEPLDKVVATLCKNAGIGYDVSMEIGSAFGDSIQFRLIQPTDRSESQTDVPKVIFSKSFLNVESLSREVGVDSEKNAIYAINGTNIDDAVVKLVNRDGEDKADYGVYRRETTVNVNCDVDEIDSYALKETEDFVTTDSFVVEAAAAESYKKDWFVGDIVTFRHKDISCNVPIIAAEIQRTADKFTVKLSAGEAASKPVSGINRTANKAVNEITQKKFDDGYVLTVKELPAEGLKNKIYVLEGEKNEAKPGETEETKIIDGYVFVDGEWRKFGGGDSGDTEDDENVSDDDQTEGYTGIVEVITDVDTENEELDYIRKYLSFKNGLLITVSDVPIEPDVEITDIFTEGTGLSSLYQLEYRTEQSRGIVSVSKDEIFLNYYGIKSVMLETSGLVYSPKLYIDIEVIDNRSMHPNTGAHLVLGTGYDNSKFSYNLSSGIIDMFSSYLFAHYTIGVYNFPRQVVSLDISEARGKPLILQFCTLSCDMHIYNIWVGD